MCKSKLLSSFNCSLGIIDTVLKAETRLKIINFAFDTAVSKVIKLKSFIVVCVVPMLEAQSDDVHAMEGEEVALWVQVRGDPLPQITWMHNGKVVDTEEEDEEGIDDSQLILHSVKASHAGVYKFEATNNLGTIEGQIRLFVTTTGDAGEGAPVRRSIQSNPIPVPKFADYMSEMLLHNHRGLREQYNVG